MWKLFKRETQKLTRIFYDSTFLYLTIVGNMILFSATLLLYFLEKDINPHIQNYFDSLWWGIATITTVAYGDIVPVTTTGRIIGIILIYTGTVLFICFTGVMLTALLKEEVEHEIAPLEKEIRKEIKLEKKEEAETLRLLTEINQKLDQLQKNKGT